MKEFLSYFTTDLEEVDSVTFLTPFLEVVRSENTTGPVTGVALSSISKILSYNLLGNNGKPSHILNHEFRYLFKVSIESIETTSLLGDLF